MAYGSNASGYWREKSQSRAIAVDGLISICPGNRNLTFVLTKILHILVGHQSDWALRCLSTLLTGTVSLKDNNAVCRSRRNESGSVAELGPAAVVSEHDVAEAIAEGGQEQSHMTHKPCELQRLSELQEAILERLALCGGWWWCHAGRCRTERGLVRKSWGAFSNSKEMPSIARGLQPGAEVEAVQGLQRWEVGCLLESGENQLWCWKSEWVAVKRAMTTRWQLQQLEVSASACQLHHLASLLHETNTSRACSSCSCPSHQDEFHLSHNHSLLRLLADDA